MPEPVSVNNDGINFKPELMEKEKLYHCFFKNKIILVYKDQQDFLNCYEIDEPELVEKIMKKITTSSQTNEDISSILEEYIEQSNLKSK
tara:strand:- start:4058 stop:4324 length:267 start_codon:yes stop_codon:yes gene_type:complete